MYVCLPNECTAILRLMPKTDMEQPAWQWDGNEDKPTLTPSVNAEGIWHGWVRAGRLVSC